MGKGGGYEVLGENHQRAKSSSLPIGTVTGSVYTACEGLKDAASRRSVLLYPCSIMPCQPYREPLGNQGMHSVYMINSLKLVFAANRACILSTDFFFSPLGFLKSCLGEKTNAGSLGSVVNK